MFLIYYVKIFNSFIPIMYVVVFLIYLLKLMCIKNTH